VEAPTEPDPQALPPARTPPTTSACICCAAANCGVHLPHRLPAHPRISKPEELLFTRWTSSTSSSLTTLTNALAQSAQLRTHLKALPGRFRTKQHWTLSAPISKARLLPVQSSAVTRHISRRDLTFHIPNAPKTLLDTHLGAHNTNDGVRALPAAGARPTRS